MYESNSLKAGLDLADLETAGERAPTMFAGFRLEADGSLFRDKSVVHLPPRELAALRLLLDHAGQIVTPTQLKQALWGDVHVTADSVPKCLSSLRARLQPGDCIQTVYKRGYRLMAEVHRGEDSGVRSLPRLAIAPFTSDLGVPEHLGSAVAEETIFRLSKKAPAPASILARDSVFSLASRGLTSQQIGAALDADLVLAGTIRALTSDYRLRVEMIRVADGVQIWVEDVLIDRSRIAGIESELAACLEFRLTRQAMAIGRPIRSLEHKGPDRFESAGTHRLRAPGHAVLNGNGFRGEGISLSAAAAPAVEHPSKAKRREAYDTYLRAHQAWQSYERHRIQDAMGHLVRAVELDPGLTAAKVDIIFLSVHQAFYGFVTARMAADTMRRTAAQIPNYAEHTPEILPAMAWMHFHEERNLSAAQEAFELSAHLTHNPWVTRTRSLFLLSQRRYREALSLLRRAIEADPYAPALHGRLAWALHLDGQAQASLEQIERALRMHPSHESIAFYAAMIFSFHGDPRRGLDLAAKLVHRQPDFDLVSAVVAYSEACAGKKAEARSILERLEWLGKERFVLRSFIPAVHVALGDHDAALAELKMANAVRCPWFFQMLFDPRLEALHHRAEFKELEEILPRMERSAVALRD